MTIERLAVRIGHRFSKLELLEQALTHRSAGGPHNERLEFLGDAILSFLVAEELFRRFPHCREGELTRMRASLVRGTTLARLAGQLGLGTVLRLGGGELKSGGRERESILADALEAILGAVYLDAGLEPCRAVVHQLFRERLDAVAAGKLVKDPKTRLQEWLQARRLPLPTYQVVSIEGQDHDQMFTVRCEMSSSDVVAQGRGDSRRKAEQDAARQALSLLNHD